MTETITVPAVPPVRTDRDPIVRLTRLLDEGSLRPLHEPDEIAVTAVAGLVHGLPVAAFCTDAGIRGGAIGIAECTRIAETIDRAAAEGWPVVGLWHSGGAKLSDGIEAMHGVGKIFAAMVRASGKIPQLSVVLGPAAGGAAYGPALTDLVIMAPDARIFITGPDIVRSVTGEEIDMAGLGGVDAHGRRSGVAHVVADSEADAYARARRMVRLLGNPGRFVPERVAEPCDLSRFLPESPRRAYDMRPIVRALLDDGEFEEIQAKWAPNIVVGLGRLAGGTVGVVANNPLRKGGCLDSLSAEKASRFVRMCDSFGVPLVVLVDVPGYLPGVAQEWEGVVRRGAKLLYAFAEAVVPRVTVVVRKSYGGAYIAMNSRALGASAVYAWPDAETAVMGPESAVGIVYRKQLAAAPEEERESLRARLIEEHKRLAGGVERGLQLGVIDRVVSPRHTREAVAAALAEATAVVRPRGAHGNIPL